MLLIVEEKLKKINDLSFEFRKVKDEKQKDNIENELKDILVDLKREAIDKFSNESDVKKFLDNVINFNNYSFNNQILIWLQRPNANYVTSFKTIGDMGYKLNKGSKGIKIFIPNFYNLAKIKVGDEKYECKPYFLLSDEEKKIYKDKNDDRISFYKQKLSGFSLGNVFDVSDTDMPLDTINAELDPIMYDLNADDIIDCFIKTIYNDGFKVKYEELKDGTKGYCDYKTNTLVIRDGMSNVMKLRTLIHEYAHAIAHNHLKDNNKDYRDHRNKYESEAESIAYVVSKYLGIDTKDYSSNYLYSWSKEKDFKELDDSLSTIVKNSKKIIANFNKFYDREFGLYAEDYKAMSL